MTSPRFRRRFAGSALVAAALFKLASVLLWPKQGSAAVELRSAGAHPAAWTAATFTWLCFVACIGAGTLALPHLVRGRRGGRLVEGSAAVVLLSMLAWGGAGALSLQEVVLARQSNRPAMVALYTDMKHSSALFAYVLLLMLGEAALVTLFAGLRRARLVPVWQPLAMVGAIALDIAGDSTLYGVLESLLLLAALGTVGVRLLRMSDTQWEHPTGLEPQPVRANRLAVLTGVIVAALAAATAALASTAPQHFSVIARSYTSTHAGKTETFKEHLTIGGKRVGHDVVSCSPRGAGMLCRGVMYLQKGQIRVRVIAGGGPDATGEITGGSGAYAGARGTVILHGLPHGRDRITFTIT